MPKNITVTANITAGHHPKYGAIIEGQEYTIDEADFGEELFHRPDGWLPPWERPSAIESAAEPATAGKKGR